MRGIALVSALLVPAAAVAAPKKGAAPAAKDATATAAAVGAKAKTVGPCGDHIFPMVEGDEWTYQGMAAPLAPTDQVKRIAPPQAKTIVITVKSIDQKKGADTVITLTEKVTTELHPQGLDADGKEKPAVPDDHTFETTITCSKTKFEVSPESFLFAGEPGGFYGMTVDKVTRTHDTSWKLTNGGIGDATWREEVEIDWTRKPSEGVDAKMGAGKLELERAFTPQQPEAIISKVGTFKAEKVGLVTTGRVTLTSPLALDKPQELPAGWMTTIWLADGVGVVQVVNAYSHMYQLVDAKLK